MTEAQGRWLPSSTLIRIGRWLYAAEPNSE